MSKNVTQKIIAAHCVQGEMIPGKEISLHIDQTLTQDATGTLAYLQLEAMGVERVQTELSVSYVDHNTLQMGFRNPDDHRYLRTIANKYGIIYSPPGTGICHQLHLENFARPGRTLLGSDSHTPTAGGLGSLAIGAGGLSVALAMAGEPYILTMPRVIEVHLEGRLTGWATAKDIILSLLGLLSVKGGVGSVMEYTGPGVETLTIPERATITNMGAELGATSSIFPSDEQTRSFLSSMNREQEFIPLTPDPNAIYDETIKLDLSSLEPMAACPSMPDKVVPVAELDGIKVDQVAIGSCTNSSYADLKTVSQILDSKHVAYDTDVLLSPGSRQVVKMLAQEGLLENFFDSGTRVLECACGPCIGMGGSCVTKGVSVRTFNRNFEGRSGTEDSLVYLVSPVTAAHTALHGYFSSPDKWGQPLTQATIPKETPSIKHHFIFPPENGSSIEIERGPNIIPFEAFPSLPDSFQVPILIKVGDNITTDHILPAGPQVTALRSNIPAISQYIFSRVDPEFASRAWEAGQGIIVGGENYGQGSSREHAAIAPRHLGVVAVIAKSFARIHRANLINFGIIPLLFVQKDDYSLLKKGQTLSLPCHNLEVKTQLKITLNGQTSIQISNDLTTKELEIIRDGGLLNSVRKKKINN
jgi:aconitate hydratase